MITRQARNQSLFITGSDWCSACMQLHKEVLIKKEFKQYADKKLILVEIDFPQRKPQMPIQKQLNEKLAKKFNVDRYPTILLLDGKGKVLGNIDFTGQSPKEFINELENPDSASADSDQDSCSCGLSNAQLYSMIKIPKAKETTTQRDFFKRRHAWVTKFFITNPLAKNKISKEAAKLMTNAINNWYRVCPYDGWNIICKKARKLYDSGERSPYFLAWYIRMVDRKEDRQYYRKVNMDVWKTIFYNKESPSYLKIQYAWSTGRKASRYIQDWLKKGDFCGISPQLLYRLIDDNIPEKVNDLQKVVKSLKKHPQYAWTLLMISGDLEYCRAWASRGSGFSYTVTRDGWKGFDEHGKLAYDYYVKAYKMHPELPEASGALVYVCSCQRTDKETITWFNRSISAQIDWKSSWQTFMWGQRPRWGGSWQKMLTIGKRASEVEDSLYSTWVPMVFVWAVEDIGGEMDFRRRNKFLREMLPKVTSVMEREIAANAKIINNEKTLYKLIAKLAKYQILCGEYKAAAANLAKVPNKQENGYSALGCGNHSYLKASRAEMEAEIKLATGPYASEIKQINELVESGKNIEAAKMWVTIMKKMETPIEKQFAQSKAVELFLINKRYIPESDKGIFALARGSSLEGVKAFLDAGGKINCRGWRNCTLLQCSLKKDSDYQPDSPQYAKMKIDMLKFLLSRGADINALAGPKWTALHLSISNKLPVPVVDFILKQKGVNINCGDCDKETPLMWCAMLNLTKQARFLLNKGADPDIKDRRGKRAIDYAKSTEMRKILTASD